MTATTLLKKQATDDSTWWVAFQTTTVVQSLIVLCDCILQSKEETNYNPARTTEAHHTQSMSIDEVNAQNKAKRKPEKPLQTQPKTKRTRDEQEVVNDDASGSRSPKDQDGVDQGDASEKKKKSKPQHDKTSHKNTSDEEVKDAKEQSSDEADQHTDKKAKVRLTKDLNSSLHVNSKQQSHSLSQKNEDDADDLTNTKEDLAKTGAGEPATQAQKGFIKTLSKQAGQDVDPTDFDRAEASKTIESLKPKADQQQVSFFTDN